MNINCISVFYVYVFIDMGIHVYKYLAKFSIPNNTVISWYAIFSDKDSMLWT